MKVLNITASYEPAYVYGGPVMSVAKLCKELSSWKSKVSDFKSPTVRQGGAHPEIEIEVYTTLANGKEELPYQNGEMSVVDGVSVFYFKRITKDHSHFSPSLLWYLWKSVKQFDMIHIHAWWNLVTMPACLIAILRGKKVLLTPRGTLSSYSFENRNSSIKKLFHQLIGKKLLNRCYFHVTSKKEAEDSMKLFQPKALFNIPNFVALPWTKNFNFDKGLKNKSAPLKLLFLSRIERKKGLSILFKSLKEVPFSWTLDIVGDGEEEYVLNLKQKAESLKLNPFINWLGPIYGEQKFELMASYDYLILPSYDENFANVVIESIFSGTPVIVTRNVGLSDYITEKDLGIVCNRNQKDLIDALQTAFKSKEEDKYDSVALNSIIKTDFEESIILQKYIHCYQSIIH